ncbi:biotin transporter BioY [Peptoniphilus asaccharolyticus]
MESRVRTLSLTRVALFVALIAIGAFIKIPVPNMPFTLQFLFTNLAGIILGSQLGALSVGVYVLLGLIGVPVFTSGGGPGYILMPTFGYLIGFIVGTYLGGRYLEKRGYESKDIFISSVINLFFVYLFGMVYYYLISNFYLNVPFSVKNVILYCFLLAVPGDIFLCFVSTISGKKIVKALGGIR